jgi:hypothetical protein
MNFADVMNQLKQMGTEANRRIYRNHGATENVFGVSTANLKTLVKAIKKDHALAEQLWNTGNYDAQSLAAMIADPAQMTSESIDAWSKGLYTYGLTDYFADLVFKTPFAEEKALQWKDSSNEWLGRAGWHLIAKSAADPQRPDSEFAAYLPVIEREIHIRVNRTRQAMLNTLVAIGARGGDIMEQTFSAVGRIGPVEIDHGNTSCETIEPISYIKKVLARTEKKASKTAS